MLSHHARSLGTTTLFVAVLLGGLSVAGRTLEADDGSDAALAATLDSIIQMETQGGYWGAVLVARDGKAILSKGYGDADYGDTPNTSKTLFELASCSKACRISISVHSCMLFKAGRSRHRDSLARALGQSAGPRLV